MDKYTYICKLVKMVDCWVPLLQSSWSSNKLFIAQGSACSSSISRLWKFCGIGTFLENLLNVKNAGYISKTRLPKILCLSSFILPLFTFPLLSSSQVCLIYRSPFPILLSCSGFAHSVLLRIPAHLFYILKTVLSSKFCLQPSRPNSRWKVAREKEKKSIQELNLHFFLC